MPHLGESALDNTDGTAEEVFALLNEVSNDSLVLLLVLIYSLVDFLVKVFGVLQPTSKIRFEN